MAHCRHRIHLWPALFSGQDMPRCILIAASVLDHGMLDDSPIRISNTELFIDGRVIFCARLDATSASDYQPESFPFTAQGLWSSFTVVGYPKKGTPKRIDPILNLSSRGVVLEWRNYIDKSEIMFLLLQSSRLKLAPVHHQCSIDFTGIMVLQISDLQPTDSSYGKNEKLLKQKGRATLIGTNLLDAISWATERAKRWNLTIQMSHWPCYWVSSYYRKRYLVDRTWYMIILLKIYDSWF